ncbi:hypothetical protein ACED29_16760 [Shewanella sp. 5S214]|uniref:hypothetical protein n=1 Tax=Shewanella sp. 5S214 TaxID=3229999 RepID=UPI00352FE2C2
MELEAKSIEECDFLITTLDTYFGVLLEMEALHQRLPIELALTKKALQEVAGLCQKIDQYHQAYPETKGRYFYTKLNNSEVEHLIQSCEIVSKINKDNIKQKHEPFIAYYTKQAKQFINEFCDPFYDESLVIKFFDKYKIELKKDCDSAIVQHVEEGNKQVYVFAIQSFPGHYYQVVTMNTVTSLHSMSGENGFKEAATYGYNSELYNPACFDIECERSEQYDQAEKKVAELFIQLYELTDQGSARSYKTGTLEYEKALYLQELANKLFINISIDILKVVDFSPLNQSDSFCAIIASHEFSEEEFYTYAKETIPTEKFNSIFPNANKCGQDYIDFNVSNTDEIVTYLLLYIKDFYLNTIPNDRYYTDNKVFEYSEKLINYGELIESKILFLLEEIVNNLQPNPNNNEEKHFLCLFAKENRLFGDLLRILSQLETFSEGTQQRLIKMYKTIIIGMSPSTQHPSYAHCDLAFAIFRTDENKYPQLDYDLETSYLKNINDYAI